MSKRIAFAVLILDLLVLGLMAGISYSLSTSGGIEEEYRWFRDTAFVSGGLGIVILLYLIFWPSDPNNQ